MVDAYKQSISLPDRILNILGLIIAFFFIGWHLFDISFSWFHDSTIAIQATIAKNWLINGERIFLNGKEWVTHPPFPVMLAMPGEILNIPILLRLTPLCFSIATLISWYKFIQLHYNDHKLAIIAVWCAGICPIFIYFAPVLNYEQPLFFFLIFGLLCYENFIKYQKFNWFAGLTISFLGAGFTEWQAGIIALGFIVDWKRGRWISLFPVLFTGIAIICSASMVDNIYSLTDSVSDRFTISFLSPNFWIIQFGRAFSLFTPISCIVSVLFWCNKPDLKKNRIIFIQLFSGTILLLVLSQWFLVHNFALYYFWLPISFGTAYLLNRFSNRVRWIIQSIMIVFTCINLYFLSTHRESFIEPLVIFFQKEIIHPENKLVLSLGSRQFVFAYRLWKEYREFEWDQDSLNNNELLITAPLLISTTKWASGSNVLKNKKELHIDFATIYVDTSFLLPQPKRKIIFDNNKIGFVEDTISGSWIIFEGDWNQSQFVDIWLTDNKKELHQRFIPGNRTDYDPRPDIGAYYHWIPDKIKKITRVEEINYVPRIVFIHEYLKTKSTMMGISHFSLIERIETEFGIPVLNIFYKKSTDIKSFF